MTRKNVIKVTMSPGSRRFLQEQLAQVRIRDGENRRGTCISRAQRSSPGKDVLDAIADEKLSGGWNVTKKNVCPECNEAKSVNGTCSC
jgi:hypothetical protein